MGKARVFGEVSKDRPVIKAVKKAEVHKKGNKDLVETEPEPPQNIEEQIEDLVEEKLETSKKERPPQNIKKDREKFNFSDKDKSLDYMMEMAETLFGGSGKKHQDIRNKLENFSEADKSSLRQTFLKTEKEIGPFGSYLPPEGQLPYQDYKNYYEKRSNHNIGFLLILLILLFNDNLRRSENVKE
ncbi:MAG: hypothetical protein JG764_1464 [Clostridiales bacterium]|jgi:hypothetical protein|nr:hypothetical protein [Clostridiales bacterium]